MLFEDRRVWKLIDFDYAGKEFEDEVVGYSAYYVAPEILKAVCDERRFILNRKIDIFSVGVVAYELFTGKTSLLFLV